MPELPPGCTVQKVPEVSQASEAAEQIVTEAASGTNVEVVAGASGSKS